MERNYLIFKVLVRVCHYVKMFFFTLNCSLSVGGTNVQAYQIATSGALPQGVVMTTAGGAIASQQQMSEEAARKRELRLLKNR